VLHTKDDAVEVLAEVGIIARALVSSAIAPTRGGPKDAKCTERAFEVEAKLGSSFLIGGVLHPAEIDMELLDRVEERLVFKREVHAEPE